MDITEARRAALEAVRDNRVEYDQVTAGWLVDGVVMQQSQRRTYGELRRGQLITEARGEGIVPVRLSAGGVSIVGPQAAAAEASR
jgi:hypothetical protein